METLKVSVSDGKVCEKVLKVQIDSEQIQKEYDSYYASIAPKAKIPGFRPGKAPKHVLKMHYGNEARDEVLKHLINHSYRHALKEKDVEPLGYPQIENVEFKEDLLKYEARVEVRPKIKLSKIEGLKAKKTTVEVKKEEIDEALKRVQDSFAKFQAVEGRAAKMGDHLIADYICTVEGEEIDKREGDLFELREDEFVKGFSKQLVGVKPEDEKEVRVTLPKEFGRQELAEKEAVFQVKVKEVKEKKLPALDDELAKDAGEFKSFEELRARIENDIRESKEREEETKFEKELLDDLVKQNKLELPEGVVKRRHEKMVQDSLEHFKRQGGPEEDLEKARKKFEEDLEPEARRQIHVAFLLDELAIRENILVSDEDLEAKYKVISNQVRQPDEVVKKYYSGNQDALEGLKEQIRNEKAIEFLKKNAKVK